MSEIRFYDDLDGDGRDVYDATIDANGLLHLPPQACAAHFPDGHAEGLLRGSTLWLMAAADGPLALVQSTFAGEHTIDVNALWPGHPSGPVQAVWVVALRRLEVTEAF